nr:AraC family transcriptional regulator [Anaerotalea alkaliphila]
MVPTAGRYHCDEAYALSRSGLETFLLLLVDEGELSVGYQNREQLVRADTLVLIDGRRFHGYRSMGKVRFRWLHFDGGNSQAYHAFLTERFGHVYPGCSLVDVDRYVEQVLFQMEGPSPNEHLISAAMHGVLSALTSFHETTKSPTEVACKQAAFHLETHYREQVDLKGLASVVSLNHQYLLRQFKRHFGTTPHDYLNRLRVKAAKQLLLHTSDSVESIAFQCGFSSASHFIRVFGTMTSTTPHQFRKIKY